MRLGCIGKCELASDGWSCQVISTPLADCSPCSRVIKTIRPALWRRPSETPSPYWTGISPRGAQWLQRCGCSQDREWRNRRNFSQCPWRYWQDSGVQWPDFRAVDQDGCSKHGALLSPSYKANVRRAKEKLTDLGEKRLSFWLTVARVSQWLIKKFMIERCSFPCKFGRRCMNSGCVRFADSFPFYDMHGHWIVQIRSFTRHCVQKLKT